MNFRSRSFLTIAAAVAGGTVLLVASGVFAGPVQTDTDGDGVVDLFDNCILNPNAGQQDTDGDGCGNRCDSDYNQSGVVDGADVGKFGGPTCFNSPGGTIPPADPVCNCDGDGVIGGADVGCFGANFNRPASQFTGGVCVSTGCPGPSAFPGPACRQ